MIKFKEYKASEIAKIIGGEYVGQDFAVKYISMDSRETYEPNTCFVAIKGEKYDGEDYVNMALQRGADMVISTQRLANNINSIRVDNTKNAIFKLAEHNKGRTKIIGVTGSVGKTTVKEMIKSILSQKYKVQATYSNHNNEIGVAQTLLSITNEDYCVVEMGMRGLGEIEKLARLCKPEISIITSIGTAHIERLGSIENILRAKCEILKYTSKYALVPAFGKIKNVDFGDAIPLFIGNTGDIEAVDVRLTRKGIITEIIDNNFNERVSLKIPSFQLHDADNVLFAYKVGRLCEIPLESIKKGILEFKNCKNRGNICKIGDASFIIDCYNASYESSKSAILSLISYAKNENKTPILLFGDMLEIGSLSPEFHYEIGRYAKENGVENILLYGKYARYVQLGFEGGIIFGSKSEIEEYICNNFGKNDVILVKASRKEQFETIIEGLKERLNEN